VVVTNTITSCHKLNKIIFASCNVKSHNGTLPEAFLFYTQKCDCIEFSNVRVLTATDEIHMQMCRPLKQLNPNTKLGLCCSYSFTQLSDNTNRRTDLHGSINSVVDAEQDSILLLEFTAPPSS